MADPNQIIPCPLCKGGEIEPFGDFDARSYRHCPRCRLIFVPERFWPSPEEEHARYDQHQNAPGDAGYISFLEKLAAPLAEHLPPGARGLDYGCGPAPVLCGLLGDQGFPTRPYDPFYFPELPEDPIDFIVSTETFEHFRHPQEELERLRGLLKPGGLLGVMTAFWDEATFRKNWHYRRDFTHLCFYRRETMDWIRKAFGFEIMWCDSERVTIFRRY
ncbi:MAG: class I SAM-dependent methyltransferase [bacterium]